MTDEMGDNGRDPDDGPKSDAGDGVESDADGEVMDPFDELGPASGDAVDAVDAGDLDDAFERMDVGDFGDEDVWESLGEDAAANASRRGGASARPDSVGAGTQHADRVIDKRAYCHQCPHFSDPPEAVCTHEGTEIVEVVDVDEFRVRNCPMVSKADRAAESARER